QIMAPKELTQQFRPPLLGEFRWVCPGRKAPLDTPERRATDARFARARRALGKARFGLLLPRRLTAGDRGVSVLASPAIKSAIERGTGRIEPQILPFSYRHLAPLVAASSSPEGVEEGEQTPARPQPHLSQSVSGGESVLDA